jgi:hypothetical protein
VRGCELKSLGDEAEGSASGKTQRPHAVGAPDPRHPAGILEEAHQAFEGVAAIERGGEPPVPVAAPAQDRPEAVQLAEAPGPAPFAAVGPVELELLCGAREYAASHLIVQRFGWSPWRDPLTESA